MSLPTTPTQPRRDARWIVLAVVLAAEVMDLLDSTVVNIAAPSIVRSLHASSTDLQWIIGGYPLILGAGLVTGGRLGDVLGRRRLFLLGALGFTIASTLCAAAPTAAALIGLRVVQGVAGAVMLPQGLGLLRDAFPVDKRGVAFAFFGPVIGLAGIFGPIIGAAITSADIAGLGWRTVFAVNVPIGLAAVIAGAVTLPRVAPTERGIDPVGAGLAIIGSVLFVLPLVQGQAQSWPAWTDLCLVAAVIVFLVLAVQVRARSRSGRMAFVPPSLFMKPAFTAGIGGMVLFFTAMIGSLLTLSLYLQLGAHLTVGQTAVANLPLAIGTAVGAGLSGAVLGQRLGHVVLQLGGVIAIAGLALTGVLIPATAAEANGWTLAPGLALLGLGTGLIVAALFQVILAAIDDHEVGAASGLLTALQSIAAAISVAALGGLFLALQPSGASEAFRITLTVQAGLLAVYFLTAIALPRRARPENEPMPNPPVALGPTAAPSVRARRPGVRPTSVAIVAQRRP